mgnify:CR=1 FL=1
MRFVKCTSDYWEFVRQLRNDSRVQDGFIERANITQEQQTAYMSNNAHHYRIALVDNQPAGYVGVIDNDIRICTHPDYQGLGVGSFMLAAIMEEYPNAYGKVKLDNEASKKLFKSVGFTESFVIFTKKQNG